MASTSPKHAINFQTGYLQPVRQSLLGVQSVQCGNGQGSRRQDQEWQSRLGSELCEAETQRHGCCCSVTQSWLTLWNPMNCSTPGFPSFTVSWSLLKLMSTESVMPSDHLILCCPHSPIFSLSQHQGLLQAWWSWWLGENGKGQPRSPPRPWPSFLPLMRLFQELAPHHPGHVHHVQHLLKLPPSSSCSSLSFAWSSAQYPLCHTKLP